MSALDPTVAKHLDAAGAESDEDELLEMLESDEAVLDAYRAERMQQLHNEVQRARMMRELGNGQYKTVAGGEKEVMEITTQAPRAIVHFAHKDFRRCGIMDTHLEALAPRHAEARFVKCDVESAPFLVERLKVRVLPCVLAFVDAKTVGRIEGFDVLGNTDSFRTDTLELALVELGVLDRVKAEDGGGKKREGEKDEQIGEDSGDDWD